MGGTGSQGEVSVSDSAFIGELENGIKGTIRDRDRE